MTAALTETVSGRTIPRYRGAPVTHDIRFSPATPPDPGYRLGGPPPQRPRGVPTLLARGPTHPRLAHLPRRPKTREPPTRLCPPPPHRRGRPPARGPAPPRTSRPASGPCSERTAAPSMMFFLTSPARS